MLDTKQGATTEFPEFLDRVLANYHSIFNNIIITNFFPDFACTFNISKYHKLGIYYTIDKFN